MSNSPSSTSASKSAPSELDPPLSVLAFLRDLSPGVKVSLGLQVLGLGLLALPWGALWLAAWLLANHGVLAIAGTVPRSRLLGLNQTRLASDLVPTNRVGLSFDDGPDPEVTPQVLALLAERGIRATFFLIGARAAEHPELVRQILQRGHAVQNHTHLHSSWFCTYSPRHLERELRSAQRALIDAGAPSPDQFRAPAGVRSPWLQPVLHRLGLRLVTWTHRGFDTSQPDPERVYERLTHRLLPGSILLLHDGNAARDEQGRPVVLTVLPRLLDELDRRGLEACPVLPTNHVN